MSKGIVIAEKQIWPWDEVADISTAIGSDGSRVNIRIAGGSEHRALVKHLLPSDATEIRDRLALAKHEGLDADLAQTVADVYSRNL